MANLFSVHFQIDYPDTQFLMPGQRQSGNQSNLERLMALEPEESKGGSPNRGRSLSEDRGQSLSDTEVCQSLDTLLFQYVFTPWKKSLTNFIADMIVQIWLCAWNALACKGDT